MNRKLEYRNIEIYRQYYITDAIKNELIKVTAQTKILWFMLSLKTK